LTDIEKYIEEFESLIETDKNICSFCKCKLTPENRSSFQMFFKIDSQPLLVHQCVVCEEVIERMQIAQDKGYELSEIDAREDLIKEGWTVECLKARQEIFLKGEDVLQ
jgi:hypothetical protein